jgi:hypothetical protein
MVRGSCQSCTDFWWEYLRRSVVDKTLIYTCGYPCRWATYYEKSEIYLLKLRVALVDSLKQEVASLVQKQSS